MGDNTAINATSAATHRNPISYSSNGADQKIARFFGPPVGSATPSAYDKVAATNYDLPEYYKGRNLFLRDTIDG